MSLLFSLFPSFEGKRKDKPQCKNKDACANYNPRGCRHVVYAVLVLYILAALIRLAYFNVTEEERQRTEGGVRRAYTGLPVTSAALIFPSIMLLQYITSIDLAIIYFPVALITGFLFLSKIQIPKPHLRGILIMIGIGVIECILLVLFFLLR